MKRNLIVLLALLALTEKFYAQNFSKLDTTIAAEMKGKTRSVQQLSSLKAIK